MLLKSIEVQGFKSFANKIVFNFEHGITGIVGPNGSGKSNVADAVRWVLGEQRIKQLRGSSMQDVIFAGTALRKSVGSAYVAITLDNSDHSLPIDYKEVTVARRIYRSGESEYSINGTLCRLKDVNELFYDTGIGKEGYSIIGQGQIEKIISSKPEDRRELFDEAAGIVKFKRRKYEAGKKLESESQNLLRVTDVLNVLKDQAGPLKTQSEKAKTYLTKREELKKLDVNAFLLDNDRLNTNLENVKSKYDIAASDLEVANAKNEAIKTDYERIEGLISELDTEINNIKDTMASSDVMREKLEGQIVLNKQSIESSTSNLEHLKVRINNINNNLDIKNKEKEEILSRKSEIDKKCDDINNKKSAAVKELEECQANIEDLNTAVESSKNAIIELLTSRANIKVELGKLDTMAEQKNIRLSELDASLLQAKSKEAEQNSAIKLLEDDFNKVTEEIETLSNQLKEMEAKSLTYRDKLGKIDEELRKNQMLFHQEKSKLEAINNITERYEGYSNSIKKVMEQKENDKDIHGVVADIIKVSKKYENAIEVALGNNIQNIVTSTEKDAKKMIEFLKENKYGKASFLPLDSIENPQEFKTPHVLNEKGVIGLASDLVEVEPKYKNVAKSMLGRIVIVDNMDNAFAIARKNNYAIRMVTVDGELLAPGGVITGGAFKSSSNLLSRRRETDELTKHVKELEDKVNASLQEIEDCKKERNELRQNLEKTKDAVQDAYIRQNTARIKVMQAKEKKGDVLSGFDSLRDEKAILKQDLNDIEVKKEELKNNLNNSNEVEDKENAAIKEKGLKLETLREEESRKLAVVSDIEIEAQKLLQSQEFEKQNLDRVLEEENRFNAEMKEVTEESEKLKADIEERTKNIEEIKLTLKESVSSQSDSEIKLKEMNAKKEEFQAKQKDFFNQRDNLTKEVADLDKEIFRLNSQKERIEEQIASYASYIWQEYNLTLADAGPLRDEELTDLPKMRKEINSIKEEIKGLGSINVNAIEEYQEVMEKLTFLQTQHDDLVEARDELIRIIDELDEAMRKQFKEQFTLISSEFNAVFKELFGGGDAKLELLEDEDILEAGIKIEAQPPGKKLQNMMQLSGGEKAFTAIALLFAIQNLKPSPFCLLDEIEAALDENNVERFAKYLIKMSKKTQFIVITHRRGTMNKADRLYGITMQEKGVSALVSVNLIDKDLDD